MNPEGCTGSTMPVKRKNLRAMSPPMTRKTVHRGRSLDERVAAGLEMQDKLMKPPADEDGEREKKELDRISQISDIGVPGIHTRMIPDVLSVQYDADHRACCQC